MIVKWSSASPIIKSILFKMVLLLHLDNFSVHFDTRGTGVLQMKKIVIITAQCGSKKFYPVSDLTGGWAFDLKATSQ